MRRLGKKFPWNPEGIVRNCIREDERKGWYRVYERDMSDCQGTGDENTPQFSAVGVTAVDGFWKF